MAQTHLQAISSDVATKEVVGSNDTTLSIAVAAPGSQFGQRQHPVEPAGFSGIDLQKPIETKCVTGCAPYI